MSYPVCDLPSRLFARALLCAVCIPLVCQAQVSYSTAGSSYLQDFNGGLPASSDNSATWTDNSVFEGWYVYREGNGTPPTYRINSTTSSGAVQHFRASAGASDGALGCRPNDTTGKVHYGLRLTNDTGETLRSFTLSYALEQWYRSGVTTPNEMVVSFRLGNPANLADDGTWGLIHHLTLEAPQTGGSAGDLNGSQSANRVESGAITVGGFAWEDGTDLWIRFSDPNDSGVDQGLGIDDVSFAATTEATVPVGGSYFGRNGYIEYQPGDLPIIITAGHGGIEEPAELADRTYGVVIPDQHTEDLGRRIANEIFARTGKRPHFIANRLHRGKLDPNREIVEGAQGDPNTEIAWHEFHDFIKTARTAIEGEYGFGFLADMHGHAHDIDRLELGYNNGATDLNKSDTELERPSYAENSSFRTFAHLPGVSFPELIRGPRSLGDLLERRAYPSVPSPTNPGPGSDPYFAGGYNIEEHGSLQDVGLLQAMQIECHRPGVRDTAENRAAFARTLAVTLHDFLYDQFGFELGTSSLFKLTASADRIYENGSAITLTVTRSGYLAEAEAIDLYFGGTATLGSDYTASATSVSFAAEDTVKTVTLTPVNDGHAEGAESIIVALDAGPLQTADTHPLTIALSDDDRVSVHVVALDASTIEGGDTAEVRITRDVVSGTLEAYLEFGGTAVRGLDYVVTGVDGLDRVVFGSAVASVDIGIVPLDDDLMEPSKTVSITTKADANYSTGIPAAAVVTILDDDVDSDLQLWLANWVENGAWKDESGNGREGALKPVGANGPSAAVGVVGTALEFDGTNDAVVVPYFALDPTAFSILFRFRLDSTATSTAFRHLFNLGGYDQPHSLTIFRVESNDRIRTLIHDANEAPSNTALDVHNIEADSVWRHYTLTASTSNGLKVYIDGALAASVGTWSGNFDPVAPLWFGWRGEYSLISSRHLNGGMEDVRIYSRELAATEVAEIAAVPTTLSFTSVGSHDGWVLESGENTDVGGSRNSTSTNNSALRAGDNSQNRQYKAFVSFDTSSIPSGATILSAKLWLKRGTTSGTNPFRILGPCLVDIKGGSGFDGSTALANADFQAAADATAVATLCDAPANGDWSYGELGPAGLEHLNRSGHTQFRVYFTLDDDNDSGNDYIGWYSGANGTSANHPVLEVTYR